MNCPVCDAQLRTVQKHNVEVDICPDCKGVWLDRGELDLIIQAVTTGTEPVRREREDENRGRERDSDDHRDRRDEIDPRTGKPRRRGGWLSDIFDSFGD